MAKQHQRDRTNYKSKGELNMKFMTTEQLKKCSIFDLVTAAIEVGKKIGTPPMPGVSEKEYANYLNYQRQLSVEAERRDSHNYFVKQLIDTACKPGQFKGWWDGRDGKMELMSYSIEDLVNEAHFYGLGEGSSHENNNHYAETEYQIRFRAIRNEARRRVQEANKILHGKGE